MNEWVDSGIPVVAGLALGAFFFGGLWWTIRNGLTSEHPAAWFLVSHVVRLLVTLAGFYFVAQGEWQRVLLCLAGFMIARVIVTRLTRTAESSATHVVKEVEHASQSR
ncbi:N-ATPase, AtpR subunit [Roseimaritima multifibrata]|uniref:N-ATPase, AtpR subunit n=1 Tax=Roseimaritima multifibrata TaxID=1930274 RepID=A0A517MHS3_9BACT|nr:ATP synthase subunit I [Roseimaritima multifibrata]QDS94428.1 N-ATPase, AtpR subunit [Roseimaritima multifibrata]